MNTSKNITVDDLKILLLNQVGSSAKFISIETLTEPKTLKKSRENSASLEECFKTNKIFKRSKLTVQINASYDNSVNNRREKAGVEEEFESGKLPYGHFVGESKILIEHNGEYYARVFQTNNLNGKTAVYEKTNGQHLSETEVEYLKNNFLSEKPEFVKSQGLSYEESSKPTNYKLSGIKSVVMDGKEYRVVGA
jgi:hypothetical protein